MPDKFEVDLDELHFDPDNPRIVGPDGDEPNQIFRYLITEIGVDDLLQSISASGLIDGDPIIVKSRAEGGYYVIEGNRRLAALKLLIGEKPQDEGPLPKIPEISNELKEALKTGIKVQSGWSDEALQAYLGYKHVTAAKEWPPEAKANFVFKHANDDFGKDNLTKFAKTLGTNYATLKRWLVALLILKQAEDNGFFDSATAPTKRYFGTFYTLLGGQEAQNFLDLQDEIALNPVPETNLNNLDEFIKWTIGSKEVSRRVNSRQQAKFEQVLGSPTALQHFRVKGDLESALLYTEYNADQVTGKLRIAAYSIEECLPKLFDVRDSDNVIEAFSELEGAYKKARLNMKGDQSLFEENE